MISVAESMVVNIQSLKQHEHVKTGIRELRVMEDIPALPEVRPNEFDDVAECQDLNAVTDAVNRRNQ